MTQSQQIMVWALAVGALLAILDPRRPRLALRYARFVVLLALALVFLAPLIWVTCAAFKDRSVLMEYSFLPPVAMWAETLNLQNFRDLFTPHPSLRGPVTFGQYFLNSLFLSSTATIVQMFFCSLGGYALAKYNFKGKRALMFGMLGSMMLPYYLFLAPLFEMMVNIGWIDSYLSLLVPTAATAFGVFLFRQAILSVPDSLIEAARVDGAGEFRIYLQIIMPLVQPMTAAFCLIVFLASWNSFVAPQMFIQSMHKLTTPVMLAQYVQQYQQHYGMFLAGTFLAILPIAVLFLVLQREFIAGLTSGAVKG